MPQAAAKVVRPDFIAAEADLPLLLVRLSQDMISDARPQPPALLPEPIEMPEPPLALTCPECGGTLRKSGNGAGAQYRCEIGHVFGARELSPAQLGLVEKAFDVAPGVLNERIELLAVEGSRAAGRRYGQLYWERAHAEAGQQADVTRPELAGNGEKLQEVSG
jgi:two-component system, chemotaxis family, protein-glutamate methylesterase/glutaminase